MQCARKGVVTLWLIFSRVPICRCLAGLRVALSHVQTRGDGGTGWWPVPGLKRGHGIGYVSKLARLPPCSAFAHIVPSILTLFKDVG